MTPWIPTFDEEVWIRSKYRYEPESGCIFFVDGRNVGKQPTPNFNADGYARVCLSNTSMCMHRYVLVHRLAWFLYFGYFPSCQLDHINLDKADNRISNLRLTTNTMNKGNIKKQTHRRGQQCTSKFKGVSWFRQASMWKATIRAKQVTTHLGLFESEIEAAIAYNEAARLHFGEFARLNEV